MTYDQCRILSVAYNKEDVVMEASMVRSTDGTCEETHSAAVRLLLGCTNVTDQTSLADAYDSLMGECNAASSDERAMHQLPGAVLDACYSLLLALKKLQTAEGYAYKPGPTLPYELDTVAKWSGVDPSAGLEAASSCGSGIVSTTPFTSSCSPSCAVRRH